MRITNVTDETTHLTGKLFDNQGKLLGLEPSAEWVIPPQATVVLSTAELAEKFRTISWEGAARWVTTATTEIKLMATARINGILTNRIDRIPEPVPQQQSCKNLSTY